MHISNNTDDTRTKNHHTDKKYVLPVSTQFYRMLLNLVMWRKKAKIFNVKICQIKIVSSFFLKLEFFSTNACSYLLLIKMLHFLYHKSNWFIINVSLMKTKIRYESICMCLIDLSARCWWAINIPITQHQAFISDKKICREILKNNLQILITMGMTLYKWGCFSSSWNDCFVMSYR